MDRRAFDSVLNELWKRLGLGSSEFPANRSVVLAIDEFDLTFRQLGGGETLVIECDAGAISGALADERTVIEMLMKSGLALSAAYNVISLLDGNKSARQHVVVQGFYSYRRNDLVLLVDLLFEVVAAAETLRQVLSSRQGLRGGSNPAAKMVEVAADDLMIFKL